MKVYKIALFLAIVLLVGKYSWATDIYIGQNAAGANSGADCADAHAASWFNSGSNWGTGSTQISPGSTVHVCGTVTGSAGATVLAFQGSGSAGNPITLLFESGAIVQAPYCKSAAGGSSGGCISANGKSYIVIDGNRQTGTVRNSMNGAPGVACPGGTCNQQATSTLIDFQNCTNCTLQNVHAGPTYLEVRNIFSENSTNEVALIATGSHLVIANNDFPDCGWCINMVYATGSTFEAYGNSFSNFGHAFAGFPGSSSAVCGTPCYSIHDNAIGPAGTNWDNAGCGNHKDGIHLYENGSSSTGTVLVYNNWFGGDWGSCPTGYIFTETDQMQNYNLWNNVFIVSGTVFQNSNSWVYLGSMPSGGTTNFFNNTFYDTLSTAGTNCVIQGYSTRTGTLNVRNNAMANCSTPFTIQGSTISGTIANNLYGSNSTILLNADGSPQSTSPLRGAGANLSTLTTGNLATLAKDTTDGGTRTANARPVSGNWDIGAFAYGTASSPTAPTNLVASPQ